jgi:NAD(P)-dependent dehydrogenase (short-subunit alcohol dehydrogenase family)
VRTTAVTGSASGIGAAAVRLLRDAGDRVIEVDIHDAEILADLGCAEGRLKAIEAIRAVCGGKLSGIVTCAGLGSDTLDERRILAVNYFGTAELLLALRPDLSRAIAPAAVAVCSWAMLQPTLRADVLEACLAMDETRALKLIAVDRVPGQRAAYATSKSAVARLVRRLAPSADWAKAGITLNAVVPSATRTPMIAKRLATAEGTRALLAAAPSPMGRIAEAHDVAEVIAYLVSGRARQLTGQLVFVDGGLDAHRRPFDIIEPLPESRWS